MYSFLHYTCLLIGKPCVLPSLVVHATGVILLTIVSLVIAAICFGAAQYGSVDCTLQPKLEGTVVCCDVQQSQV